MALPLPYAPNIDVDAEKLRMARETAAVPSVDVGAGVGPAIQGAVTLKDALDARDKKAAAEAFQRDYLQKGNEGIAKMYADAGSPKDFNINAYMIPAGTPPDKAQEIALLAAKDLAAKADKTKQEGIAKDTADAALAGKTPVQVAAASQDPKLITDASIKTAEATAKALDETQARTLREQIKKDDRAWDKTLATFKAGLERDTKAGKANVAIKDDLATLSDLATKRKGYGAQEFLTDVDKIEYADVVRQMSIISERIAKAKRDGATDPALGNPLTDPVKAQQYVQKAGGDKNKARDLAKADGYTF